MPLTASTAAPTSPRVGDVELDDVAADPVLQLVRRARRDDEALVDDDDLVGELVGLLEVLRREQQRRPLADELADDGPHAEPAAWVESGRRLVEEQHLRTADETAGEVEATLHAAGVGLGLPVGGVDEVEALEQLGCLARASDLDTW